MQLLRRKKDSRQHPHADEITPSVYVPPNAKESYDVGQAKVVITDVYSIYEPPVPQDFKFVLRETTVRFMGLERGDSEERLLRAFLEVANSRKISAEDLHNYWYHIKNVCLHAGKITPLLQDKLVEDISCSGAERPVYVYHSRHGWLPTSLTFTKEELENFVHTMAQKSGFTLSFDNPIVDASLYDGSRINITFSVSKEPSFAIRKARKIPYTPTHLIRDGFWPAEIAALLWLAVENRCSLMFVGGTAAGKTTSLNAVASFIPPNAKVVSIEDTYEIILYHRNWTPLITKGDITQLDLVKVALRQRPEYLIIGEARGLEVREMFSAMGIGHTVLTTFHAANTITAFQRLFGEPYSIKSDQFRLLDFVITTAGITKTKRRCVAVDLIGTGDDRIIADVFSTPIMRYYDEQFIINNIDAALERMSQKAFVSKDKLKKEYEKRVELLKSAPVKPDEYFEFMRGFYGEKKE